MVKTTNHNDDYAVKHCKTLALREAAFPRTHSAQTMGTVFHNYSIVRVTVHIQSSLPVAGAAPRTGLGGRQGVEAVGGRQGGASVGGRQGRGPVGEELPAGVTHSPPFV